MLRVADAAAATRADENGKMTPTRNLMSRGAISESLNDLVFRKFLRVIHEQSVVGFSEQGEYDRKSCGGSRLGRTCATLKPISKRRFLAASTIKGHNGKRNEYGGWCGKSTRFHEFSGTAFCWKGWAFVFHWKGWPPSSLKVQAPKHSRLTPGLLIRNSHQFSNDLNSQHSHRTWQLVSAAVLPL